LTQLSRLSAAWCLAKAVLGPAGGPWDWLTYKALSLADPASPTELSTFQADSFIISIIDDHTAVGQYSLGAIHYIGHVYTVLRGDMAGYFQTMATLSEGGYYLGEFGANDPPFFVIGYELWKLEDR